MSSSLYFRYWHNNFLIRIIVLLQEMNNVCKRSRCAVIKFDGIACNDACCLMQAAFRPVILALLFAAIQEAQCTTTRIATTIPATLALKLVTFSVIYFSMLPKIFSFWDRSWKYETVCGSFLNTLKLCFKLKYWKWVRHLWNNSNKEVKQKGWNLKSLWFLELIYFRAQVEDTVISMLK